jgi:hypothetical protein
VKAFERLPDDDPTGWLTSYRVVAAQIADEFARGLAATTGAQMLQAISCPQHNGDFTLPSPFGHLEIATLVPSSLLKVSCSNGAPHFAHVMFTPIPHLSQV